MSAIAAAPSSPPRAGERAPEFTLPSTDGTKVTLSGLRGRTVLVAFFPLAFSPTCTAELCELRDEWDTFLERGLVVLPISVDSTYTLKEYKQKYGLQVDLLSDFKREATRRYGVLNEDRFFSNRSYFLIDADGVVRWAHVEDIPSNKRTNAEILAEVDKLN